MPRGYPYPLTICPARYDGVYSGAKFHAWNKHSHKVPREAYADDVTCQEFWFDNEDVVGKGKTPNEAVEDLLNHVPPLP